MRLKNLKEGEHYVIDSSYTKGRRLVYLGLMTVVREDGYYYVDDIPADIGGKLGHGGGRVKVWSQGQRRDFFADSALKPVFGNLNRDGDKISGFCYFDSGHGLKPWAVHEEKLKVATLRAWRGRLWQFARRPENTSLVKAVVVKDPLLPDEADGFSCSADRFGTPLEGLEIQETVVVQEVNDETNMLVVQGDESGRVMEFEAWKVVPNHGLGLETYKRNTVREETEDWRGKAEYRLRAVARQTGEKPSLVNVGVDQVTLPVGVLEALLMAAEDSDAAIAGTLDAIAVVRYAKEVG